MLIQLHSLSQLGLAGGISETASRRAERPSVNYKTRVDQRAREVKIEDGVANPGFVGIKRTGAHVPVGFFSQAACYRYSDRRRRAAPSSPIPARAVPNRARLAGSGAGSGASRKVKTAFGLMSQSCASYN
jgi:hypothetical protein